MSDTDLNTLDTQIEPDPRLFIAAVERAMKVLEVFESGNERLSIADITSRTGLGRSATQRLVYTLFHLGYLRRDTASRNYSISFKVVDLCQSLIGQDSIPERIAPALQELAQSTGETVAWIERIDDEIVVLKSISSPHFSHVSLSVGQRFQALPSSSGQAILSHLPLDITADLFRRAQADVLERLSWTEENGMAEHLAQLRENGFARTEKTEDQYSVSLSAAVLDARGVPVGALNVSAPRTRFPKNEAAKRLAGPLKKAARQAGLLMPR